jgi:eukaryotic-like serine/threonine-protein kinase
MFKFITRRALIWNLLAGIVVLMGIIILIFYSLDVFTKHGKFKKVPNVVGKSSSEAIKILEASDFKVVIQDSLYTDSLPGGICLRQVPEANEDVKVNRTVYLTLNNMRPPLVELPNIYGYSKEIGIESLLKRGFKLGDTTFKNDFTPNSILEVRHNNRKLVKGDKIPYGSKIDLLISKGLGTERFDVPDLVGLTYAQALIELEKYNLQASAIVPMPGHNIVDTMNAFVGDQSPPRFDPTRVGVISKIVAGSGIDLFLRIDRPAASVPTTDSAAALNALPIATKDNLIKPGDEDDGKSTSDKPKKPKSKPKPTNPKPAVTPKPAISKPADT